jgi:hypothetical protein
MGDMRKRIHQDLKRFVPAGPGVMPVEEMRRLGLHFVEVPARRSGHKDRMDRLTAFISEHLSGQWTARALAEHPRTKPITFLIFHLEEDAVAAAMKIRGLWPDLDW